MATAWNLVPTGFAPGIPEEACLDLSKGTDIQLKVWKEAGPLPNTNVLYADLVEWFPETAQCAAYQGVPGCADNTDGKLQAYVCSWVNEHFGDIAVTACLKHELYHLLASRFQPMATHNPNARSLMHKDWNMRKPPGFLAEDRRLLKDYYA